MRKIIYSNTIKHNILKTGMCFILIMSVFLTILDLIITHGSHFDFSIYIITLIFLIGILLGHFLDLKFNRPLAEFNLKQHEDLIKYGTRCDGEILEIEKHRFTRAIHDDRPDRIYYTLRIKYFSKVYNKYIEDSTTKIENISNYDILDSSKKCIVYEKEDISIIESTEGLDLFKFWNFRTIINGLKINTKKGYAFIVTEADIIENPCAKK